MPEHRRPPRWIARLGPRCVRGILPGCSRHGDHRRDVPGGWLRGPRCPHEESHEIALFANPAFAHVAFKVSSLAELRSLHARGVDRNIPVKFAADHGVSLAFYFDDPDGNMVEVYWPTRDGSGKHRQA